MTSLQIQNCQLINLNAIEFLEANDWADAVNYGLSTGYRMIGLFPVDKNNPQKIIAQFADSITSSIQIIACEFPKDKLEFESFANRFPQTNYFECELAENHAFSIKNHPWMRPVRKQNTINPNQPYEFYQLKGDEVHEVAVGPIHAGVIEPGHFRFQCHGELVYNLEINLGYQHRGIEELILKSTNNQRLVLVESIAGDTVIGHTNAHCSAIEGLSGTLVPLRAQIVRSIAEELERIAMHLASLGGVANDIGFAIISASYGRLRTLTINSLASLCGSRFGRGLFVYGGVRYDMNDENIQDISSKLLKIRHDVEIINNYLLTSSGAITRFDGTGIVSKEFAQSVGLVGMIARSCGIESDTRIQYPYGAYHYFPISEICLPTGDVFARVRLRTLEINESIRFILEQFDNLSEGQIKNEINSLASNSMIISMVEGWRGEIVHTAITNEKGEISHYKVKDPSFNNWYGLSLALQKTAISDFPLCNKSFDLSYSGHDL